jgi:tetratricopeptide (TPR) repeat protein
MSSENSDHIEQRVDISGETGDVNVIGKIAFRITQVLDEQVLHRLGLEQRTGFILLGVLVLLVGIGSTYLIIHSLADRPPERMTGDFRIAVAGFAATEQSSNSEIGKELAQGVYLRLVQTFDELALDFTVTVWGPDQVGVVEGDDREARAQAAERTAQEIGADIVVYGTVSSSDSTLRVAPEFYVSAENFYHAAEVAGEHDLGTGIPISGQGNIADRIEVSGELTARSQALSHICIGLAYYSIRDFEEALNSFYAAEAIEDWEDEEGRYVLYLLIGNAANKEDDFDTAEVYYQRALDIDPEYARGYLGLADVYYRRAIEPFGETEDPTQTDLDLIALAAATYERATTAANQPPLADINTKANFGQGQCYFMRVYAGEEEFFNPAIARFEAVIEDYADGENPRMRELAAESYARLAVIYDLSGYPELAVENYEAAAELLEDNPERHAHYQERAEIIREAIDESSQP